MLQLQCSFRTAVFHATSSLHWHPLTPRWLHVPPRNRCAASLNILLVRALLLALLPAVRLRRYEIALKSYTDFAVAARIAQEARQRVGPRVCSRAQRTTRFDRLARAADDLPADGRTPRSTHTERRAAREQRREVATPSTGRIAATLRNALRK